MADELEPTAEDIVEGAETEEAPEVEAHSAEQVLGLQGISIEDETGIDAPAAGSCSSCLGSTCM
ncbi:hypothetical protein ACIA6D_37165 [Streptomyces cacaoi]